MSDDATKYAISSAPQLHPALTASVPIAVAATAPLDESDRARRASNAMTAANKNPSMARILTRCCLEGLSAGG